MKVMTIGEKIKYFRIRKGITQARLAELSGIHPVSIRKYETNRMIPGVELLSRIAKALNVSLDAFISSERTPSDNVIAYLKSVKIREKDLSADGYCFTNDFDKACAFQNALLKLIPDLVQVLHVTELTALIDFVYDKTCEDLREKNLLSEESKQILKR